MSFHPPSARQLLAITAVIIAVHALTIAHRRSTHAGDFDISRELGRRFLAGEDLYAGGLHYPYMPAAAMVFAPLALLPPWLGFGLRYTVALAALWLTLGWLARATRTRGSAADAHDTRVIGLTLLLASHYIVRDLDDSGPHLLLLAAIAAGVWCIARERQALGAAACGFAIAVKAPHGLLLLFFLWQRRWRLALLTAAATAAWIAMPSLWMGPASWWRQQMEWTTTVAASVRGAPLPGPRDSEERVQNQALSPTVVRVARRVGLDGRARWLGAGASIALLAWLAWATRRARPPASAAWLRDVSAVLVATPLLAPVAWIQHLVLVIPALALILARGMRERARWRVALHPTYIALGTFALLALVLNRELLGRAAYLELLTWGLHGVALLLLLAVLLIPRSGSAPQLDGAAPSPPLTKDQ